MKELLSNIQTYLENLDTVYKKTSYIFRDVINQNPETEQEFLKLLSERKILNTINSDDEHEYHIQASNFTSIMIEVQKYYKQSIGVSNKILLQKISDIFPDYHEMLDGVEIVLKKNPKSEAEFITLSTKHQVFKSVANKSHVPQLTQLIQVIHSHYK